ncbi:competence protein CoiA family protein [Novilysobacter luteus]|uniref:Uncharacterized protein n=1 Tax=Novilysobacter luteus TaxID=2822368 RepID=A0ABM8UCD0_9GAMM|nr:hypothetical protein [Lysobacter luteus]CAG4968443.1 hypothetical protein LYB30171_00272 [Lysobacter luteus]
MNERKVPFGLREGVLHYVSEVDTGLACNCTCPDPACAKPLIARNLPSPTRKRAPYFAHASQTPGCGGRESALHRMGKEIVECATQLRLPGWSALDGELSFSTVPATLAPGSAQEVVLREGQMRPDVKVIALTGQALLQALYVEIKVSHAVDWSKRERVMAQGLNMMEIDLADVSDEDLQDKATFAHHVLERADNRHWIHIASAPFLSRMLGHSVIRVVNQECREKRVPTQKGNQLVLREQAMWRHEPAEDDPKPFFGELASYMKGDQRVDCFGNHLPYRKGLYVVAYVPGRGSYYDDTRFKTQLRPIVQDVPWNAQKPLL